MKVLGFDCAGRGCAASVLDGDRVLAARALDMERGQSERLVPLIAAVLADANLAPADLDLIAVTTGPGGFTGIRIGLACARGLALATGKPAVGVTNFEAAAAAVPPEARDGRSLVAVIELKRAEFYLQVFSPSGPAQGDGALVAKDALAAFLPRGALLLAGDAAARLAPLLRRHDVALAPGTSRADAGRVALLGRARFKAEGAAPLRPLYLRAPDTTKPRVASP